MLDIALRIIMESPPPFVGCQSGRAVHRCGNPGIIELVSCSPNRPARPDGRRLAGVGGIALWQVLTTLILLALGLQTAPAQPRIQQLSNGHWPDLMRGQAGDVKIVGHYAYVASGSSGLTILDVSNPTNCVRVGASANAAQGYAVGVAVAGNWAYVADELAGLLAIDVSDPTCCVRVGKCANAPGGYAFRVAVTGNRAYVADVSAGLQVIDVTNPTNCATIGGYQTIGDAHGIAVAGDYAYLTEAGPWTGSNYAGALQ
jgi:hypothetical protein